MLSLSEFLEGLLSLFSQEGLRFCILRNYEGFPDCNVGNDIDFLIHPIDLPRAIHAIQLLQGIRIVGYAERHYVAHVFVEGVASAPGLRALELDFIWSLNWKGLEYLSTDTALATAIERQAGTLSFLVPSPVHEAIISLLSSLLVGGWLKEKYFPKLQRIFADNTLAVSAALSTGFGAATAAQLVDSVIAGNRQKILDCVPSLRRSLAGKWISRSPFRGLQGLAKYHAREFDVRCTPKTIETLCIIGPDCQAKATLAETVMPMLHSAAKVVEISHLGPSFDCAAAKRNEPAPLNFAIVMWILEEWINQFRKRANLTLRFDLSCYYDVSAGTRGPCIARPRWLARLIGNLLPSIDLCLALASEPKQPTSRKPANEEPRPIEVFPGFLKTRQRTAIIDANMPAPAIAEQAYAAIIDALARRTSSTLKARFGQRTARR